MVCYIMNPDLWWVFELDIYNTRLPKVEQSILKHSEPAFNF